LNMNRPSELDIYMPFIVRQFMINSIRSIDWQQ
jgi:hypothetical protein